MVVLLDLQILQSRRMHRVHHSTFIATVHGRSTTFDCELTPGAHDPSYPAATDAIAMIVSAVWLGWLPLPIIIICLKEA